MILIISVTGCYTVIWDPSQPQLPRAENNNEDTGFYADPYYGQYAYFYDSPWWYDISFNSSEKNNTTRDGNSDISTLRNTGNGRGTATRSIWELFTAPPSRSSQSGSLEKQNTGSSNTGTTTRSTERSSSSNKVRNNDGSRKTDKDKGRGR